MHRKKPTSPFRYVSAVLLSALLLFPILSLAAHALSPYSYNMSSDYKNSIYYENLRSITLTGNGAADLLAVAMSQLGYHEGNSNSDFAGANTSGSKNFVEYNRLYGKLDNNEGNGYSYGYAWCASFVNFCLRQADIPEIVAGGEVSCTRWIRDFLKPSGRWKNSLSCGGTYTPKAGDLIFFKRSDSSALSTHVGIVRYTDGTYVHTVEGNTASGAVALDAYLLDSSYIIGYGTPKYQTGETEVCDYGRSGEIAGLYIVTADSLNIRAAASASASRIGTLKKSEIVTVKDFDEGFAKIVTADGKEGYASRYYLELVTVPPPNRYTVTFLDDDLKTVLAELSLKEGEIPIAPTVPDVIRDDVRYTLVGWSEELSPVTADTTYIALYAPLEAPEEGGGAAPTETGNIPGNTETSESEEERGCNATVAFPVFLISLLPAVTLCKKQRDP